MGYSPVFVDNFKNVIDALTSGAMIQVTFGIDSICKPCPNQNGTVCNKQSFIETLDARHAKALQLKNGDTLTWADALIRIRTHISIDTFHTLCEGCPWKDGGMCESALKKLHHEDSFSYNCS